MKMKEKLELLRRLNTLNAKYLYMETVLEAKGEDFSKIERARKKLEKRVHELRKSLHSQWQGSVDPILALIRSASADAQRGIRDIENDVNVAGKIVKAAGKIDELVEATRKMV